MSERIAIVGSRFWPNERAVRNYIMALPEGTTVVSGAAKGVDSMAAKWARYYELAVVEHPVTDAEWAKFGRRAGPLRNARIVADCDRVVAFWDGASPGTRSTIELARKAGKPVRIVDLEGRCHDD